PGPARRWRCRWRCRSRVRRSRRRVLPCGGAGLLGAAGLRGAGLRTLGWSAGALGVPALVGISADLAVVRLQRGGGGRQLAVLFRALERRGVVGPEVGVDDPL